MDAEGTVITSEGYVQPNTGGADSEQIRNEAILNPPSDERLVKVIVKMRERQKEITKEADAALKVIEDQRSKIEAELMRRLHERGATSTKTGAGTAYMTETMKITIADGKAFGDFVIAEGNTEFFHARAKVETVKQYMKDNGDRLPPGLSSFRELGITVRTTK